MTTCHASRRYFRTLLPLVTALLLVTMAAAPMAVALSPGTPWAWGYNGSGQLGDGTTTQRTTAVQVSNLTDVVAVDGGDYFSLAITSTGAVRSWGRNTYGELGLNDNVNRSTPVAVPGLPTVQAVATGGSHSLALTTTGAVYVWGYNYYGQLGLAEGDDATRLAPVQVTSLPASIVAVAAGAYHSLAVTAAGTVYEWGLDGPSQHYTPTLVTGLSNVAAVAAGNNFSLARTNAGTVYAWGDNDYGKLGLGDTTDRPTPVQIPTFSSGVIDVAAGANHALAVTNAGAVYAWGWNGVGALGIGAFDTNLHATPALVSPQPANVSAVETGGGHSLALTGAGAVYAWGSNSSGQLGLGHTNNVHTATLVSGLTGVAALAGGGAHTLAIVASQPVVPEAPLALLLPLAALAIVAAPWWWRRRRMAAEAS